MRQEIPHLPCLKSALNHRLFIIRRVSQHIPKSKLMSVVHSLWVSKLRYGLQLCTKVQLKTNDRRPALMKTLQLAQNRLLRFLNNSRLSDQVSTRYMLDKFELLSVNQLSAEIKLIETWKSLNVEESPIRLEPYNHHQGTNEHQLRPQHNRIFNDTARLQLSQSSFNIEWARVWNDAPAPIRTAPTLNMAKKAIKVYCKSLPV